MPAHPYYPSNGSNSSGTVTSVNGEQGDVVLTAQDLEAQPHSNILTDIASVVMPDNSFLMVNNTGSFTPATCMPAGVAWLGYSTVDQQKAHLSYAEVADSGSYNDLTDKPVIPSAQVSTDWNSTSGVSQVLNKPSLSPVALSGSYTDLTNKPTIPSVNYPVTSVNSKTGAVVLTASDVGAIATGSSIPYASLTGTPTSFSPSAHTHQISDVTGLQAALDSKVSSASLSGYATTTALTSATTGIRKVETFLGTTDASGNFTITFINTYTTPPDVQPQIIGGTFNQTVRVVSVTNTGCVVQAAQRNVVTLLSVEVLLGATVNLAGANVSVQVTARS